MADLAAVKPEALLVERDFARWMRSEQRRVFLLCLRMLGNTDDADQATQDVFFKAYQALEKPQFAEVKEPGKWLTRIAVNTCLDRLRSRRWMFWRSRASEASETVVFAQTASPEPDAEDRVFAGQIAQRLEQALERLSDRQRSVFLLKHYEGMTLEEIGQALGLDLGTVKAHLARALKKLREELKEFYHLRPARTGATPAGEVAE